MIPDGLAGCNISVVFATGGIINNFSSIAAGNGGPCGQSSNPLPSKGFLKNGAVELVRSVTRLPANLPPPLTNQDLTSDIGTADFSSIEFQQGRPSAADAGEHSRPLHRQHGGRRETRRARCRGWHRR